MSSIVKRNDRFNVVTYNGRDPITGTERRRWHPAGLTRAEAQTIRARVDESRPASRPAGTLGAFMTTTWLASKPTISTRPGAATSGSSTTTSARESDTSPSTSSAGRHPGRSTNSARHDKGSEPQ